MRDFLKKINFNKFKSVNCNYCLLIQILDDFLTKYGHEIGNSLITKWKDFIFKNFTIISEGIKNPKCKKDLLKSQSEDGKKIDINAD